MRVLTALFLTATLFAPSAAPAASETQDFAAIAWVPAPGAVSAAIEEHAQRVLQASDHGARAFAIVDKRSATMAVYHVDGALAGVTPVLLGLTPGDLTLAGVGQRTQTGRLRVEDRTTPAGRFDSRPGRNLNGEAIVWIDYGAALAIHRLRRDASRETRMLRMASSDPRDKRVSAGCVVVPEAFYDAVVHPLLGNGPGVVYVMPEAGSGSVAGHNPA